MVGLVCAAAAYCLGPSLAGARTLIAVNSLTVYLPWQAGGYDATGHELCQGDTIDTVMPGIAYVRHELLSGHLGSWQSYSAGGGVLSSVPNLGMLDPLSLPYWVLPLRWAPAFVILLTWVAGTGGTYLFLRRLSVGRPAATLAGFVFSTSGFMVMWSNWPQTRTAALIPALFWATERVVARRRGLDVALVAAVVASMIFGGFPEVTGFALYGAGGYFVVRAVMLYRHDLRQMAGAAGAAAAGLALGGAATAVQLLPFISSYTTQSDALTRASYGSTGLPASGLETLFAPDTNGLCVVGTAFHGSTTPIELVAYVGAATVVLAVLGVATVALRRSSLVSGVVLYFTAAVAVAAVVCWVSPTAHRALDHLPVFSDNPVGRIRSVVGFGAAVLAAFGFDWLTARRGGSRPPDGNPPDGNPPGGNPPSGPHRGRHAVRRPRRWGALWAVAVSAAGAAGLLQILRLGHRQAFEGGFLHDWDRSIWIPLVLVAATSVVALTAVRWGRGRSLAFVVIPILVVAQGAQFFHAVMPGDSPASFYPDTGDHAYLAAHLGHDRFGSSGLTLYSATAFYYRLRSATGHQFTTTAWNTLLAGVDPKVMASPTDSDFSGLDSATIARQPILDQMGVRYFVLPPEQLTGAFAALPPTSGSIGFGAPLTCSLDGGPLRGVTVRLAGPLTPARSMHGYTIHAEVTDGAVTVSSARYFSTPVGAGTDESVAVAGEALPVGGRLRVTLSVSGSSTPLVLAAAGGDPACAAVTPVADGLRLVYAGAGAVIYQRLDALPRIRWAGTADDVAVGGQAAAMAAGIPAGAVLLAPGTPAGSGRSATVRVTQDSGDHIDATVDAAGRGYLVVADPMQSPGWSVDVDGRPAHILAADFAMVAVAVPAGTHRIAWTYRAPGQVPGLAISLAAVVVSLGLVWSDRRRRPRPVTR